MKQRKLDRLCSWGRYLYWSDIHFRQYYELEDKSTAEEGPIEKMRFFASISLWLASLYVVVEGWKELGEKDRKIDELVDECPQYIDLLRKYRNAVYHYQPSLLDNRFFQFTGENESLIWAMTLELEFQRFLWELPEKYCGEAVETDEIRNEIRNELEKIIGWIPSNILRARKHNLEKLKTQALKLLASSGNEHNAAARGLRNAIEMIEKVIEQTSDNELDGLLTEKK